jgi:FO synthase subunit 1
MDAIAQLHSCYGHIQEVILQPHSPGTQQIWDAPAFDPDQLPEVIATARQILPSTITLQIPPNLVPQTIGAKASVPLLACLDAGARDLGGIGPKDEVNPDYPHPHAQKLKEIIEPAGWQLVPRLPVYPQHDSWLPPRLQTVVQRWRTAIRPNAPVG